MLPDEPLDAALADAVALSQLSLRGSGGEGRNEPLSLYKVHHPDRQSMSIAIFKILLGFFGVLVGAK